MENNYIKNGNNRVENPCMTPSEGKKRGRRGVEEAKMSPRSHFLRVAFSFVMVMFCVLGVKGQTTGLYFIANNNTNAYVQGAATNWYLVPASDGGETGITIDRWTWNDHDYTPLVTTYQTQKDNNSVWAIVKVDNENYYYLIHVLTGKYMTWNTGVGANSNRRTFHMETNANPGNTAQFKFSSAGNPIFYSINPRTVTTGHMYMNPSNGNKLKYYATDTQDPANTGPWVGGTIGLYNKNANNDAGSKWFIESSSLLNDLSINYNSLEGSYTITWHGVTVSELPIGYVIRYTEDGSDPVSDPNNTAQNYDGSTIVVETDNTTVNAVLIGHHNMQLTEVATQVVNTATPEAPTFEMTCDSKLQINCNISTASIYYNYTTDGTDPTDPDNNSTLYTDPVSMADNTKVKAVAYNGTNPTPSPYSEVYTVMNNTTSPTFVLTETTATINHDHMANVTLHYTTDGSDPTDPNGTAQTYTGTDPLVISSLDYNHDVNILVYADSTDRGASCPLTVIKRPKQPTINPESECIGTNRIHTLTFTGTEEGKTYWYALSNGQSQPAPALNTFTEYTPGEEVDIAAIPAWNGTDIWVTLHAYAKTEDGYESHVVGENYMLKYTDAPSISYTGNTVTITAVAGATIHYTDNGGDEQTYSDPFTVTDGYTHIIRATAQYGNEGESCEATIVIRLPFTITTLQELMDIELDGAYDLGADIEITDAFNTLGTFTGSLNGNYYTITNLGKPLFSKIDGGTVKNLILDNVGISGSGNVGAICNEADGATKIYNCGILSGSVSGGTNTGGLVGLVKAGSSVRVVNCYNFADVTGGGTNTYAAGIVGKNEGTVSTDKTVGNVRIALCMMYGSVSEATNISPVYGGNHVGNVQNYTEYNFYLYSNQRDLDGNKIEKIPYTAYNDQQAVSEEEYLTRFPFHRHILNTHRELGAFFLFGASTSNDVNSITLDQISEIGHWVVKKDIAPYPIVEPWGTNTKKVLNAPTPSNILTEMGTNGYLSVTVNISADGMASGSSAIQTPITLPITDMDEANYDYTWGKVVLPFANEFRTSSNEVWTPDYSKICTGWKITSVTKESTTYTTYSATNYNFADRDNPQKDIYGGDNLFIFAQGGYYIVPYGVTAITIEANFANAIYLSDAKYDVGYSVNYDGPTGLGGNVYANTAGKFHEKTVHHNISDALGAAAETNTPHTQAIVLVGNYHFPSDDNTSNDYLDTYKKKAFTLMSIDADNNQEPDYAFYSKSWLNRPKVPPMRIDFVALVPVGMAAHVNGSKYYPGLPIWNTRGWFEMTETSLCWANQFELGSSQFNLDPATSTDAKKYNRLIINSGYFVQMVRASKVSDCKKLIYCQIGGNTYIKEYYPGSHSATPKTTTLVPVNVTGGEIEQCFMTGYGYSENAQGVGNYGTVIGDNIYFWCAGGKIGKFLGAYMERPDPATQGGKVNMTAKIDHALITEFYGGGTSPEAPITGKIDVTIKNSRVDRYCGGPEFGDMTSGETVTTEATNTTFGYFYGAGFGGTGITYYNYEDKTMDINTPSNTVTTTNFPNDFFKDHYYPGTSNHGRLIVKNGGIGTCYKFEYIVNTSVVNKLVARFYVGFAKFDLATTGNVTNTLENCTILDDFYGGGCQGKVAGTVTSTLTDCTVNGNAYGAGYKATANDVQVYTTTDPKDLPNGLSKYTMATGIFSEFHIPEPDIFQWEPGTAGTSSGQILYTDKPMSTLGDVTGDITLTLEGHTVVNNNVFGGGNESKSLNNATVTIKGTSQVDGNVFGGGNKAIVNQNTTVILQEGAKVHGNVYGGGNNGSVGGNSEVKIQDE